MLEEVLVKARHVCAGRTIDEHGVENVHADDLVPELVQVEGDAVLQALAVIAQVYAFAVEDAAGAAGDAHYVYLEVVLLHEFLPLGGDLSDEVAAYRADAANEDVELLVFRKEETVVDDVEGLAEILAVDYEGDVVLLGALGAGYDADAVAAEDAEELAGYTGVVLHVLADDCDGSEIPH